MECGILIIIGLVSGITGYVVARYIVNGRV